MAARDVRTIETDFVQTRTLKILKNPIVSRGTMAFRRPSDLRWEYASPIQSVLVVRGGSVGRYIRRDSGWVTDSGAKLEAMKVVLGEINNWLGGDFASSKMFKATLQSGPPAIVELEPIDPSLKAIVSGIVIELGDAPGTVKSIEVQEGLQGTTHIEFVNSKHNVAIPDVRFAPPAS
jgi:outer membrane lipoprotein carrier protein